MAITNNKTLERNLFAAADKLRKNIDAAEYKHVVLGLIFLKYISDSFEDLFEKLSSGQGEFKSADPEDKDEYLAENIFYVPQEARWSQLLAIAKLPSIGQYLDSAMDAIERENPTLKGILPKVYGRPNLDKNALGQLIDLIGSIALGDEAAKSKDILGRVYEYFLGQFALAEGKKGGQFYTPRSVVELLVEMLEPFNGRVLDPCCGSGGMFVQSEKFVLEHQGKISDISIFGQESNQTTWRLCKMNLAIRGIDGSQVKWNNEGSFLKNEHKDLKVDYILANPPFNDDDWSGELLKDDSRWVYGTPPTSNANYAWIQHFLYHLAPNGRAGFVLGNSSLSATNTGEHKIRERLIDSNLVECIVALPRQLFFNTSIPACLWFLNRSRQTGEKILLIDARSMGYSVSTSRKELSKNDIDSITLTYHNWRNQSGYINIPGYCKEIEINDVKRNDYNLSPNKYIDIVEANAEYKSFDEFGAILLRLLSPEIKLRQKLAASIRSSLEGFGYKELSSIDFSIVGKDDLVSILDRLFKLWFIEFNVPFALQGEISKESKSIGDYSEIPNNWPVYSLQKVAQIVDCLHSKKPEETTNETQSIMLQVYNISDDGLLDLKKKYCISDEDYSLWTKNIEVVEGDCIITNTGRVGAVAQIPHGRRFAIGRNITAVRPIQEIILPSYLICFLLSDYMRIQTFRQTDIGTILDSLNVKGIKLLKVLVPPIQIQIAFSQLAGPIRHLIEIQTNNK